MRNSDKVKLLKGVLPPTENGVCMLCGKTKITAIGGPLESKIEHQAVMKPCTHWITLMASDPWIYRIRPLYNLPTEMAARARKNRKWITDRMDMAVQALLELHPDYHWKTMEHGDDFDECVGIFGPKPPPGGDSDAIVIDVHPSVTGPKK